MKSYQPKKGHRFHAIEKGGTRKYNGVIVQLHEGHRHCMGPFLCRSVKSNKYTYTVCAGGWEFSSILFRFERVKP